MIILRVCAYLSSCKQKKNQNKTFLKRLRDHVRYHLPIKKTKIQNKQHLMIITIRMNYIYKMFVFLFCTVLMMPGTKRQ